MNFLVVPVWYQYFIGRPPSEYLCPMDNDNHADTPSRTENDKVKTAVAMYKELSKQEERRQSKLKKKSSWY